LPSDAPIFCFSGDPLPKIGYILKGKLVLIEMKCVMCKSPRILKFVDGFGDRRIFCHKCGRSFLEGVFFKMAEQRSLQEFSMPAYNGYNMRGA
jgi:hypothetical protein